MLQATYNGSDSYTAEELKENIYWQYFCGYEYIKQDIDVSEVTIRRFRNDLGEEECNEILKELLRLSWSNSEIFYETRTTQNDIIHRPTYVIDGRSTKTVVLAS